MDTNLIIDKKAIFPARKMCRAVPGKALRRHPPDRVVELRDQGLGSKDSGKHNVRTANQFSANRRQSMNVINFAKKLASASIIAAALTA